jgi:hypothetical protein
VDRGVSRGQRGGSPTVVNLSFLDSFAFTDFRKIGIMNWGKPLMENHPRLLLCELIKWWITNTQMAVGPTRPVVRQESRLEKI